MADETKLINSMARLTIRAAKFERFTLIFAICDSLEEQEHNVIELSTICNTHGVTIAELNLFQKEPVTNLKTEIQHYLQEHFPDLMTNLKEMKMKALCMKYVWIVFGWDNFR